MHYFQVYLLAVCFEGTLKFRHLRSDYAAETLETIS